MKVRRVGLESRRVRHDRDDSPPQALAKDIILHRHDLAKPTQQNSAAGDKASTLPEELVEEILLLVPPDDPARLIRATVVCKAWQSIVSDDTFRRRYRRLHGTPPLQGYICTQQSDSTIRFVPMATSISVVASHYSQICLPQFDRSGAWITSALDCRHGRVLIEIKRCRGYRRLIVWDTINGSQQHLSLPTYMKYPYLGAVLCGAKESCDHHDCHGGPFLVVLVGMMRSDYYMYGAAEGQTRACVYSSETGAWSSRTNPIDQHVDYRRTGLLVGDALHFTTLFKSEPEPEPEPEPYNIVKYDLCKHELSEMHLPASCGKPVLIKGKDGRLGVASMLHNAITMWSWQVDDEGGISGWVKDRVMELDDTLFLRSDLICMAEGTNIAFIGVLGIGVFTVNLRTRQVRKIGAKDAYYYRPILPYMSFSTPKY